ncbi:MAG: ribosome small subunit-dependent GTPase A [Oscillospiraceae bacterium]|nr:ribosome small subunit-dependent GTPase A [Oscillospiraceae bacterium]
MKGLLKKNRSLPLVGDNVIIDLDQNKFSVITKILERKNFLIRPSVANVDQLIIVVSTYCPEPDFYNIDIMLAIARLLKIKAIILLTKTDIKQNKKIYDIYSSIGYRVFEINNLNIDLKIKDEILSLIKNKLNVLAGNSGVGKTSFINSLFKDKFNLKTGETSKKLGRGRHVTKNVEIIEIDGCSIVDTPGFSSIGIEYYKNFINKNINLDELFVEFCDYKNQCKFNNCSHISEIGCKIIELKNQNKISESRYSSYEKLTRQIRDIKKNIWR